MTSEKKEVRVILWDWNGTLLDDVDVCIESMNTMLSRRNKPLLSREYYREIFTFPVIDYYRRIGWNLEKESWDDVALEYIGLYLKNLPQAPLHKEAMPVLDYLAKCNYRQVIISAMEQASLLDSVRQKGISSFFERIIGLGDHYAHSKTEVALRAMEEIRVSPAAVCLIGDTLHDLEVASHIGCDCILVSAGHQTADRLAEKHNRVIRDLTELKNCF